MKENPKVLINYCIKEKLTIDEGISSFIERKFSDIDKGLRILKGEITKAYGGKSLNDLDSGDTVTSSDVENIEGFLKFLDSQSPDNDEK